jgi:LuxR family transcriptional regulator, maltose regulon positive regulatory protein
MGPRIEAPILEAKLYPATGTGKPLPRPTLDGCREVLDWRYPVVVVVAPAGYGKSTQLTRWYAQLVAQGVPCAWLSFDEDDDDQSRFTRHLMAALKRADPRIGTSIGENLPADFAGSRALLEALAGDLAAIGHRLVLFLDDLQFVRRSEVLQIVDWLVNYGPRNVQEVIASREEPRLRLSGLRVRRQLFEVDIRQMQFSAEEASNFYRDRLGQDLPKQSLQRLLDKTEGWPAALELAALALDGSADPAGFVDQFAGSDRSVVDYLCDVLLSRLDEPTRAFVFRIALFDRVSAGLAQSLDETCDAGALLDVLRARNLFLIPLDRAGTWVRFHHLVGEFFRGRFQRMAPAQAAECLLRGARWLHANGHIEDAVNCAIRAQGWEQAAQWIAECVEELAFRRGYHQTILRWMNALPEEWVDHYPVIRIQFAFSLTFTPRQEEYEAQVHRLQRLLQSLETQPQGAGTLMNELRCAIELQAAMSSALRDQGARGGELAAAWLAHWPDAPQMRKGVMGNVLAFGHKTTGHIDEGLEVIATTRRWLQQSEGHYPLAWTSYVEAVLLLKRGSYLEARRACESGLELVDNRLNGHPAHASLFHGLLAGIAYEFDKIAAAVEHLEQAMSRVDEYGPADAVIMTYATQARLQRLRHHEESAIAILHEGQELGERRRLRRVTVSLAAEECLSLARADRLDDARVVARRFGFHDLPAPSRPADLIIDKSLRAASRYLLRESPALVVQALTGAIEHSQQRDLMHRQVELLLLRSLAYQQEGDLGSALVDLQKALAIAAPRQYLRVFLDEAGALRAMIDRLDPERMRGSEAAPLARQLQLLMGKSDGPVHAEQRAAPVIEELTRREVAILKRLESGLSNKEIAEAIFISEGTLKWHLHNIYGKLAVKNRSGALIRARALGVV